MATVRFPATIPRPISRWSATTTATSSNLFFLSPSNYRKRSLASLKSNDRKSLKWVVRLGSVAQEESPPKPTTFDAQPLVDFLYEDLPHLFDDQGIDRTAYDERVKFRDPITKHDSISGYLFNIAMLKKLFNPDFLLHWVKQVRKYEPFIIVETNGDKLSGSSGFNSVAGYIFGKNSTAEKIPMTTPVFTQAFDQDISKVSIQIVLPSEKDINSLPAPNEAEIKLRKVEGGIAAVSKFSGKPTEDTVRDKENSLRSNLVRDGLKTKAGCLFARYNDPGRTWNFIMRNEVIIWLEEFSLD